jgi:NTP pyrophosphatase (non-canonical NTP hydrolase)
MNLNELQAHHDVWLRKNFPDQQSHQPLLGLTEEVGELAHAHLKSEQGIRGFDNDDKARDAIADAIGDIVIFLASYCNTNGFNLARCVELAWEEVSVRDWTK